jgi:acyl-CoA reductase-like NAD-dependent aldehyde dehydrogenase
MELAKQTTDDRTKLLFSSFIDGRRIEAGGERQPLVDCATGEAWAAACVDPDAVGLAVTSSAQAFADPTWRDLAAVDRAVLLRRLGDLVHANARELGEFDSLTNGKTHAVTLAEMRATAQWYHYYASAIELRDAHHRQLSRTADALIIREPLGIVVAITPFNAPLSLGSWKLAPALAMGNAVILKPPAEAPASSIRLAELAIEAGFPPGIVNVVIGDGPISQDLATRPAVAAVSFTGSTATACRLGAEVTGRMKRFLCEAGGKSAHIIFEDGDIESAVIAATQGAFSAAGQTCVAGSRILVQASIAADFLEKYLASVRRLRLGAPSSPRTHIGPLGSRRHLQRVRGFVDEAVAAGARVAIGGRSPDMPAPYADGFWFEPTVLVDVTNRMPICQEEVFGPVVTIQRFGTEEEAVALANDVDYGLAAGFWTRDLARVRRVSRRLQAGTVWVNTYRAINMRVPFGGYKKSGLGRENGPEALDEFSQIKSIITDYARAVDPFAD